MKRYFWDYLFLLGLAGISISLDQWTKSIVANNLALNQTWMPLEWLAPYARIVHWKNTGAAFGMLQNFGSVFKILPFFVVAAILFYYPQVPRSEWYLRIAMGMMMGGAVGNLIDRLTIGHVIDFVSVGTFPVWNVADASISTGTAILILGMWIEERKLKKKGEDHETGLAENNDKFDIIEEIRLD